MEQLPRLNAEEAIATAERVALGSGRYEREDARRIMGRLREAVGEPVTDLPKRKTSAPLPAEQFRQMGIGVDIVPRSAPR